MMVFRLQLKSGSAPLWRYRSTRIHAIHPAARILREARRINGSSRRGQAGKYALARPKPRRRVFGYLGYH
jgi:hypothetical protein